MSVSHMLQKAALHSTDCALPCLLRACRPHVKRAVRDAQRAPISSQHHAGQLRLPHGHLRPAPASWCVAMRPEGHWQAGQELLLLTAPPSSLRHSWRWFGRHSNSITLSFASMPSCQGTVTPIPAQCPALSAMPPATLLSCPAGADAKMIPRPCGPGWPSQWSALPHHLADWPHLGEL